MSGLRSTRSGFIGVDCDEGMEAQAKAVQAERDVLYRAGSPYQPAATDSPWVGPLSEICFDRWMTAEGVWREWLLTDPLHNPDFLLTTGTLDVKASRRRYTPGLDGDCSFAARQAHKKVGGYAFGVYEWPQRVMWFVGFISQPRFMAEARYCPAGTAVCPAYVVREGNEVYNIPIARMMPPLKWLEWTRAEEAKAWQPA